MTIAVFHGSPRKGNTYKATAVFLDQLSKQGDVRVSEFFLPKAMPEFCTGCQLCMGHPFGLCPHSQYVSPILDAIVGADALLFTTPHYGNTMSGCMKNLLDHLDFLTMNVSPQAEVFQKKAFILTTGAGSAAAIRHIESFLKNWGINRVYSLGLRMFTNKWDMMPAVRQVRFENRLRRAARGFYRAPIGRPYLSTVFMYHMFKFTLKKYVGEGNYPYENWKDKGYFEKRPF